MGEQVPGVAHLKDGRDLFYLRREGPADRPVVAFEAGLGWAAAAATGPM
ncbi:hypothetical protein GCM10022223_38870 [Kineosporia mesophila]|uniref:Uncharacterized protein n=1 Tax=Kineosporia mesophila TaxID=566012 RepID=A0ABP6ZW79_9ACTN|nr:hypothetical protein [Kineosporia mesophila]MCD5348513.1 hypothetical protein [Kineosporia mesophila]